MYRQQRNSQNGTGNLYSFKIDVESLHLFLQLPRHVQRQIDYEKSFKQLKRKGSFITQFLSLITHHLKHFTPFGTITHLSSLNIFQLFVGPIPVPCAAFTFFSFFFSLQPPIPKLTKPSEKKKEKEKKPNSPNPVKKKEKKKKKEELKTKPVKEKKKKKKGRTKDRTNEKKKEKNGKRRPNPGEERKKRRGKKSQRSEGAAVGPSMCV